jgi:hypothetical protein
MYHMMFGPFTEVTGTNIAPTKEINDLQQSLLAGRSVLLLVTGHPFSAVSAVENQIFASPAMLDTFPTCKIS